MDKLHQHGGEYSTVCPPFPSRFRVAVLRVKLLAKREVGGILGRVRESRIEIWDCVAGKILLRRVMLLHRINEERTRKEMIDPQLERAGWYLRDHAEEQVKVSDYAK